MAATRLLPAANTHALLAIDGPASATWNTVVEAVTEGGDGNLVTLEVAADSAAAENVTFEVMGTAVLCHFEDGVSTVADFEAALAADPAASALLRVKTPGTTQAYALVVTDDDFAATALTGGGSTTSAAPDPSDPDLGVPFIPGDAVQALVRSVAGSGTMTATVTLWGYHEELARWFRVKQLNAGSAIAETSTDSIEYAEWVGLGRYSRLYAQLSVAGTGTEVAVYVDRLRRDSR